jgi:DNA modification methylase
MKDRIKQSIKLEWQKIKALQPDGIKLPYNTAHLKKSLLKYGFSLPFYVWESEGEYYCIDGHHRLDVLNELIAEGHKVPKELNAVEIEAKDRKEAISILVSVFNQKSNPFAEEYLIEFLEVENIDIQEVNIESINVVSETIEEETVLDAIEDDFDSTPPTEAITVLGDLYEIGEHRLLCGDSTDSDQVAKLMNAQKADMVFTSPPYNANTKAGQGDIFNKKKSIKLYDEGYSDNLDSNKYIDFVVEVLDNCFLYTNGFIFWNVSYNANSRFEYIKQISNHLDFLIEQICWKKSSTIPFKGSLMRDWEPIYLFSTNGDKLGLDKVVSNHWEVSNTGSQQDNHKACFPIQLPFKAIELVKKSELILEPFCGSGSTMVASHQLKRKCYGMELDPKYCDVIVKRMIKLDPTLNIKRNGVVIDKKEFE